MGITKSERTVKGAVVIANQFQIPAKFNAVGEKMEDLLVFDKHEFADSLFNPDNKNQQAITFIQCFITPLSWIG